MMILDYEGCRGGGGAGGGQEHIFSYTSFMARMNHVSLSYMV